MENINFGELIKHRLDELHMTQSKLAHKIGVTPSQVSHYLTGKNEIPFQNMVKICRILNLNLNEVYGIYDGNISREEMKFLEIIRSLHPNQKDELIHFTNYLLYKQRNQ